MIDTSDLGCANAGTCDPMRVIITSQVGLLENLVFLRTGHRSH